MAVNRHSYVGFYASDWLAGTARMTRLHKSIYFDVCCYIWDQARPCPAAELPLMLGDLPNWRDLVQDLVDAGKLVRGDDGSLCNERAISEAEKAFDLWQKKSAGGRTGAGKTNKRKSSKSGTPDGTPDRSPAGTPDGSSPKTAGSPDAEPEPEPEPTLGVEARAGAKPTAVDPFGPIGDLTARCGRAAGVAVMPSSTRFADQLDTVREWIRMGLDPDTEIIPELERDAANSTATRHSLKYFTPAMAKIAAKKDAAANGRQPDTTTNLRGSRPNPALDLYNASVAAEERPGGSGSDHSGNRLSLPSGGTG